MYISQGEQALQKLAEDLSQFTKPKMTDDLSEAIWMTDHTESILKRVCEAVAEKSNGTVTMQPVEDLQERIELFTIEVLGQAVYFKLKSKDRVQSIIVTQDSVIFDSDRRVETHLTEQNMLGYLRGDFLPQVEETIEFHIGTCKECAERAKVFFTQRGELDEWLARIK